MRDPVPALTTGALAPSPLVPLVANLARVGLDHDSLHVGEYDAIAPFTRLVLQQEIR